MYGKIGRVELELFGDRAIFTDPASKQHGHPVSYRFPVSGTISGTMSSIYWHPTKENFYWNVVAVRVMNKIQFENIRNTFVVPGSTDLKLVTTTYLKDVKYQIRAEYSTWSGNAEDESIILKSEKIFERRLKNQDSYYDLYLGKRECPARYRECRFGTGDGYYDNSGTIILSENAFIGFKYPKSGYSGKKLACYAPLKMVDGIITYPSFDDMTYTKTIVE